MNAGDLTRLRGQHPAALEVWYDRMHQLSKAQLIETLLTYMTAEQLSLYLLRIEQDNPSTKETDNGN
jgi:hypothetical protein